MSQINKKKLSESALFVLNPQYSTTGQVTLVQPEIINQTADKIHSMLFLPDNPERKAEGGLRTQGYFKKTLQDKPLISVITVVFNGAVYLEQTINSVISQPYNNVEYIVIDGGSTDGTLEIIKKYAQQIDYWTSEADEGISDAFNKGVSLCTGELVGIINADDWYESGVFKQISMHSQYDIIHGQIQYWRGDLKKEIFIPSQDQLDKEMTLNHPTCFVRLNFYKKHGAFNNKFKIAMDYDLLLRAKGYKASFFYLPLVISNMRYSGVSDINWISTYYEAFEVKVRNNKNIYFSALYLVYQILRRYIRIGLEGIGLKFIIDRYRKKFSIMSKY